MGMACLPSLDEERLEGKWKTLVARRKDAHLPPRTQILHGE